MTTIAVKVLDRRMAEQMPAYATPGSAGLDLRACLDAPLVLEPGQSPTGALSRSWSLTRGSRWRMFGLLVTMAILLYVPLVGLGAVAAVVLPRGALGAGPGTVTLAVVGVVQMLLYPLLYCVLTVAYYDLRVRKEGFDLEVLASTLQPA